jgi:hypothetical protein
VSDTVPRWVRSLLVQLVAADELISPLAGAVESTLDGRFYSVDQLNSLVLDAPCFEDGEWLRSVRRVVGPPLNSEIPVLLADLKPWVQSDGGPQDGDDTAHRSRINLAIVLFSLAQVRNYGVDEAFRRGLSQAVHYGLARFVGYRQSIATEWSSWTWILGQMDSGLLRGLPFSLSQGTEEWLGESRHVLSQDQESGWNVIAFRASGLSVICGEGISAVGGSWGCELSDGCEVLAVVGGLGSGEWCLEGARNFVNGASFRLLRSDGARLMVTGRQGRIVVVSEASTHRNRIEVVVSADLCDGGPRRLESQRASLALDKKAAWRVVGQRWLGEKIAENVPNRLRVILSPGSN